MMVAQYTSSHNGILYGSVFCSVREPLISCQFIARLDNQFSRCLNWLNNCKYLNINELLPLETLLYRKEQYYLEMLSSHLYLRTHMGNEAVQINHFLSITFS